MRIEYERSGGFAGMHFTTTVETAALPHAEAVKWHELVEQAKFFELPAMIPAPTPGIDRFVYKLLIDDRGLQHTVEVGEAALPESLRPLIEQLQKLARRA